jgi:hypothetical protein
LHQRDSVIAAGIIVSARTTDGSTTRLNEALAPIFTGSADERAADRVHPALKP